MDIIAFTLFLVPVLATTRYLDFLVELDLDLQRTVTRSMTIEQQRDYEVEL